MPVAERPAEHGPTLERARVEAALLPLPVDLKESVGVPAERLSLLRPSLSQPFPDDPTVVRDQAGRVVALNHLLAGLRVGPGLVVRDLGCPAA